jgi:hypothetical protein
MIQLSRHPTHYQPTYLIGPTLFYSRSSVSLAVNNPIFRSIDLIGRKGNPDLIGRESDPSLIGRESNPDMEGRV